MIFSCYLIRKELIENDENKPVGFQIFQIIAKITYWVEPFKKKHDTQYEDARPSGINLFFHRRFNEG